MKLVRNFSKFELSPTLAANEQAAIMRAAGKNIIHMGFGQSPFPVPERLQKALKDNVIQKSYLPTAGLEELRETVLTHFERLIGFNRDDYDVLIAPGSKLVLYALQMAIEGDLIIPVPSWVSYEPQSRMLGCGVIPVPAELSERGYEISPEELCTVIRDAREKGLNPSKIILNYPSNPTGLTMADKNLRQIAEVCQAENIFIISDEIYGEVAFDGQYRSIAKYAPEVTAVSSGLSKHLSLGGWRLGVGLIPRRVSGLFKLLNNIASETWSSVSSPIQYAAIEAYKGHPDIEDHVKACADIHALMNMYIAEELRNLGVKLPLPQGAFYNYPDFEPFRMELEREGITDNQALADRLLLDEGVLTLPGRAFGANDTKLTLRISATDYDGEAALDAYMKKAERLNEDFIKKYAAKVYAAPQRYKSFLFAE